MMLFQTDLLPYLEHRVDEMMLSNLKSKLKESYQTNWECRLMMILCLQPISS